MKLLPLLIFALLLLQPGVAAPVLQRGPYLQKASETALTICWRTSSAGAGRVRFGTNEGNLTNVRTGPSATNHRIRLTNLTPATTYFYEIATDGTVLGTGPALRFTTSPAYGSTGPMRFWVLGDPGTGASSQLLVRNAFAPVHAERPADFWMMLGDNAYPDGSDTQFQIALFNIYQDYLPQLPLWSCIGNHETYSDMDANGKFAYDDIFDFPTAGECGGVASGTERYYSWNYANVHFVSLDSMTSSRFSTGAMATWLKADLEENLLPWVVAFWHHPPYSKGTHDSDLEIELKEMRTQILPILEDYGVDLVLGGHSHNYERSYLLDGHYGLSTTFNASHQKSSGSGREEDNQAYQKATAGMQPHKGAVYVVAGCSGGYGVSPINHPVHFFSMNTMGSLVIDVEDQRMDVKFLRYAAAPGDAPIYSDHFTILKQQPIPPPLPLAPTNFAALPATGSQTHLFWTDNATTETRQTILLSTDGLVFQPAQTLAQNVHVTLLKGLQAGQTYLAKILVSNSTGSVESTTITFTQPITPTPIEIWRFIHWGNTTPVGERENDADPDGDGWNNLLEYALGTSPIIRASAPSLTPSISYYGTLSLTFQRQPATDLVYAMEFASDPDSPWDTVFTSSGEENTAGPITVEGPFNDGETRYFGRLRVSLLP